MWLRVFFILTLVILITEQCRAAESIPRAALAYQAQLIREARFAFGLDAPIPMLAAQIHQESHWNPQARSAYASGLAQFTPQTADWISGVYSSLGAAAPTDPAWALRAMMAYDKRLFDGVRPSDSECDRWRFSLSDYNGGPGRRINRQRISQQPGSWQVTALINPGISIANQKENQDYPIRIIDILQSLYVGWTGKKVC